MRSRIATITAATSFSVIMISGGALAVPGQPPALLSVNHAHAAAVAARTAFEARMANRRHAHVVPAVAALPHQAVGPFTNVTHIEQASRDTLPSVNGAEPD